jgi:GNAT superfamily N-acetyltransferase
MQPAIDIRAVTTRGEARDFIAAAAIAQGAGSPWVRPLDLEQALLFNPAFSPFARANPMQRFVAYRDGRPAGRVAAIHNLEHLARHGDATGHFGFFDAVDDLAVVRGLMEAAEAWLAARGLRRISGPFNASVNHEIGMLIGGFDEPHVVKTNYSPPHYAENLAALGYRKAMDVHAHRVPVAEASGFVARVRQAAARRPVRGLTIRKLRYRGWRSSFVDLLKLYNETWAANWSAVPLSVSEAKAIADVTLPVVKPDWIEIAEIDGDPVALLAMIPDANEAIRPLDGKLAPWGWLRLLWHIHRIGTKRARIALAGIAPRWRNTPAGAIACWQLFANAIEAAQRNGVEMIEMSWMLETNRAILALAENFEAAPYRSFRIFEKPLADAGASGA